MPGRGQPASSRPTPRPTPRGCWTSSARRASRHATAPTGERPRGRDGRRRPGGRGSRRDADPLNPHGPRHPLYRPAAAHSGHRRRPDRDGCRSDVRRAPDRRPRGRGGRAGVADGAGEQRATPPPRGRPPTRAPSPTCSGWAARPGRSWRWWSGMPPPSPWRPTGCLDCGRSSSARLADPLVQVPGVSGATELGDGRAVLILDTAGLARYARSRRRPTA